MTNRLLVNPGSPQAWEISLQPGVNRIGRAEDNDFPINHQSISTHHCEITVTDTAVYLKDLGSTNGSFVERVPVTEIQLYPGQHVQFGAIDMLFESDMAPVLPEAINLPATGGRIVSANPGPAAPPPPPPPVPTGGLRINRAAPSHAAPPPPTSESATPVRQISPLLRKPKTHEEFAAEREATDRKMFLLGICGAVAGGMIGMFGWYFLIKFTHMEIGYAAWGVGAITGAGARLLARQGSSLQGIICAVCALFAILGGQYFALQSIVDQDIAYKLGKEYNKEMKWAKSAVEAKTPEDVIHFLSVRDDTSPSQVTEEDIKKFNDLELPEYRDFTNGKPSKEEYVAAQQALIPKLSLADSIGLFTIIWSLMGIISAWWIGSGNEG
jgi:hypothetical protein